MQAKILFVILFVSGLFTFIHSQDDIQIGSYGRTPNQTGGLFDYSNPSSVNIKVQLWGYVRYPGTYIVPIGTSLNELISFAGGPNEDANLDDIRVVKIKEGTTTSMLKYDYNDLVWTDEINSSIKYVKLDAGDVVVIPGEPRYFLREDITFYLYLITALTSTTALILSITNNN